MNSSQEFDKLMQVDFFIVMYIRTIEIRKVDF
jgi:hypothetical protein